MSQKSKVAVIGLGNIGTVLASHLAKSNRPVIVADRTIEKANKLAEKLGTIAHPASIPAAIKEADIIVFTVWFDTIKELFNTYASELSGKIIVDPSNPIAPDGKGGFVKAIDKDQSSGLILASLLPQGARLAKALGTLGAGSLDKSAFQKPDKAVSFYATDDADVNERVEELIEDAGFAPLRVGNLTQSIRIEVFGDLHEFGALGKTVTLAEAKKLIQSDSPATPIKVIEQFLANTTNPEVVNQLVAEDATYISLNYDNSDLKRILPWTGTAQGPKAFVDTFTRVFQYWQALNFEPREIFGSGENVAVFGSFTYKSNTQGITITSPFSIHAKVNGGKITYFQFMEDTFATASTFKVSGKVIYHSDPQGSEVEI